MSTALSASDRTRAGTLRRAGPGGVVRAPGSAREMSARCNFAGRVEPLSMDSLGVFVLRVGRYAVGLRLGGYLLKTFNGDQAQRPPPLEPRPCGL